MDVEPVAAGERLRIAVLGDFDGVHARAWLRWFIDRGHDVHAIRYYPPRAPLDGVTLHVLRPEDTLRPPGAASGVPARRLATRLPRGPLRMIHALRYRAAGLRRVVREIAPDVLHAHFLVEHGFYGTVASFHPYVVTAWGSDVLVEPRRDPVSRWIAKRTIACADLITSNNRYMADRLVALGAPASKVDVVTLGADRYDLERADKSVNVRPADPSRPPCVISTRAHEPLYNIGEIIDALARVSAHRPDARLVVAHGGSLTEELRRRAGRSRARVEFAGLLGRPAFRDALTAAEVFVSVPSSDATSVALLQAMAAGCFPVVSDLPAVHEWIDDGVNGLRVPLHRLEALADAIERALADGALRRDAAAINRRIVEERGLNETQMAKMERLYLRLAGRERG